MTVTCFRSLVIVPQCQAPMAASGDESAAAGGLVTRSRARRHNITGEGQEPVPAGDRVQEGAHNRYRENVQSEV